MIWKLLLTLGAILAGWFFIRAKLRESDGRPPVWRPPPRPLVSRRAVLGVAYGVAAVMLLGSGWYLYRGWARDNEVFEVQVVNANTGVITPYQARRRDIQGRVFRTLDGREIRLADVERMILMHVGQGF